MNDIEIDGIKADIAAMKKDIADIMDVMELEMKRVTENFGQVRESIANTETLLFALAAEVMPGYLKDSIAIHEVIKSAAKRRDDQN